MLIVLEQQDEAAGAAVERSPIRRTPLPGGAGWLKLESIGIYRERGVAVLAD